MPVVALDEQFPRAPERWELDEGFWALRPAATQPQSCVVQTQGTRDLADGMLAAQPYSGVPQVIGDASASVGVASPSGKLGLGFFQGGVLNRACMIDHRLSSLQDGCQPILQRTRRPMHARPPEGHDVQDQNMAQAVQNGEITAIQPSEVVSDGQEKEITLTISKVDISSIGLGHLKVKMGKETRNVISNSLDPGTGSYLVKFKAPGKPPAEDKVEYSPVLSVGSAQTEVRSKPGVSLKYKPVK
jgi:hypothetical protein